MFTSSLSILHPHLLQLMLSCVCAKGLQTLSEEVSQSTHSRMLWLEKENKCLLRTVEELQSGPLKSSTQLNYCQRLERDTVVCSASSSTTCKQNMIQRCLQIDEDASSHRQLHRGEFKEVLSQFRQDPDLQEGQPEDTQRGDHFKDLMPELEDFKNDPYKLCCLVESRESVGISSHDLTHRSTHPSYVIKQTQQLEAKCRALDTVNQHLQTALDNSGTLCRFFFKYIIIGVAGLFLIFITFFSVERKVQRLEMELQELEAENQSLQATLEELRLSTRHLEQLETEKQNLEQEITALERDKRQLEKENRRLRQQVEHPVFKGECAKVVLE